MPARTGEAGVQHMPESMNEISLSADRMHDIIWVIEDIDFQTRILALNAAVEAARTGEGVGLCHRGKGSQNTCSAQRETSSY